MGIKDRLERAGFSPAEIDEMVEDIQKGWTPGDDEANIDVNELAGALSGIRESMEKSLTSDDERDEREEFYKAQIAEATSVVEAVSAGADAIVVELQAQLAARNEAQAILWEQNQAMAKGILAIGEALEDLRANNADLHKSMGAVSEALDMPMEPKAQYDVGYVPTPHEAPVNDRQQLISKALKEIQTADSSRAGMLHKAIVALEAGSPVDQIRNNFLLH